MTVISIQPMAVVTTDEYFGGCPQCGKTDGYVNDGADHWFICDAHRTRWYIGSNLFSSWREDRSQDEIAATMRAMSYNVVKPVQAPTVEWAGDEPLEACPFNVTEEEASMLALLHGGTEIAP